MNTSFEAWLDRVQPIEKAEPIFQATTTVFTFTVLDSSRDAVNLTGYAAKFAAKGIDDDEILFDKSCTLDSDPTSGILTLTIAGDDEGMADSKECLGELRLWSSGDTSDPVTHRVQFRFFIVPVLV